MNVKQKWVLIVAAVLLGGMAMFPPWASTDTFTSGKRERPAEYAFIFNPPRPFSHQVGVHIDSTRWIVPMIVVAGLAAVAYVIAGKRNAPPANPTDTNFRSIERQD